MPAGVHVEPWLEQAGVPLVIVPLFADQPSNGRLVEEAGAGIALPAEGAATHADAPRVRRALERVLAEPGYRASAARIAAEMEAAPAPGEVLEHLARTLSPPRA